MISFTHYLLPSRTTVKCHTKESEYEASRDQSTDKAFGQGWKLYIPMYRDQSTRNVIQQTTFCYETVLYFRVHPGSKTKEGMHQFYICILIALIFFLK